MIALVAAVALLAGCAATPPAPAGAGSPNVAESPADDPAYTVVVFGDSWGYGAHCGDCTPWPKLLEAGYESEYGVNVDVVDLVENGGNTDSLLAEFRNDARYREAIAGADVVIINQGVNDFDQFGDVFQSYAAGTCGGADGMGCLSALTEHWRQNLDGFATEVEWLREGQPTALRLVGVSNEFYTDPGLGFLGKDMGTKTFASFNSVSCEVAAAHGGQCVDLRPVLNGPAGDEPADPNTQEAMQAVADAIVAVGLAELER
ncbi:SGNH/GDSL hydrolase family protein [uncultured Microbacterium sp.]|uniref:SGNH/GDSL hydrolase family protein n=1 Tax=uncultured Microbacterium sp. TaxID=191216 RepID=UPI0028D70611|nr:SGNH/GDSL hydrolase family protein [uncultured Microbacterium sp.]